MIDPDQIARRLTKVSENAPVPPSKHLLIWVNVAAPSSKQLPGATANQPR
jgi:hypothetical protein